MPLEEEQDLSDIYAALERTKRSKIKATTALLLKSAVRVFNSYSIAIALRILTSNVPPTCNPGSTHLDYKSICRFHKKNDDVILEQALGDHSALS